MSKTPAGEHRLLTGITRPVWILGLVSFFADLSGELVYPIIPLFLTITLGAPATAVGIVEGVAEGTANATRLFSGRWADRTGARKPFVVAGYTLAAIGKLVLAVAPVWPVALLGRAVDRFGKGLRSAPRDALLGDLAAPEHRGRVFGFHRSMDTLGAILGPLVALAFLARWDNHLRWAVALAVIPGIIAVLVLRWLPEHRRTVTPRKTSTAGGAFTDGLPLPFLFALAATTIFMLGNSSDAFLILRSKDLGLSTTLVVLAYVAYNVVYAVLSWPIGALSDRVSRPLILAVGYAVFAGVYFGFAATSTDRLVWPLFLVYGAYIALTDGISKALVSDLAPSAVRSTAMGVFQGVTGLAALFASVTAGVLWDHVAPSAPFFLGAGCAGVAAVAMVSLLASGRLRPIGA